MPCKDFVEQDLTILVSPKKCLPHKTRIPPLKTLKTHSKNQTIEIFFPPLLHSYYLLQSFQIRRWWRMEIT